MTILLVVLGAIIAMLFIVGTPKAIAYQKKKQIESGSGVPADYDPHYTRSLEIEQGLKVETKCDDSTCKICQWKIRNLFPIERNPISTMDFVNKKYQETLNTFIKELPDGMSDDYYDMVFEDFERETEKKFKAQLKEIEQSEEERYYATPSYLIKQYKAEGREFNRGNNSWSSPKANALGTGHSTRPILTPSTAGQKIIDANKKHWRKRHPDAKPKEMDFGKAIKNLSSVPPNSLGKHVVVIDDFDKWMRQGEQREAGIRALKSGAAARRESERLLFKAQLNKNKEEVAHEDDDIPMTVVVLDDLVNKAIVKWGVMDAGHKRDHRVWSVDTETQADDFVKKNPTWMKVRRLIIDTGWTDI